MQLTKTFAIPALIVAATLLAMSGACSMHDPGPYEGGGRSTTAPLPESTSTEDSAPPVDNFVPPDVGGNKDVTSGG